MCCNVIWHPLEISLLIATPSACSLRIDGKQRDVRGSRSLKCIIFSRFHESWFHTLPSLCPVLRGPVWNPDGLWKMNCGLMTPTRCRVFSFRVKPLVDVMVSMKKRLESSMQWMVQPVKLPTAYWPQQVYCKYTIIIFLSFFAVDTLVSLSIVEQNLY